MDNNGTTRLKHVLSLLCLLLYMPLWGQVREVRNAPSPEVSNLGTFGSVPVGHYTGTPNITVPLYTMQVGKMTVPITAMYHTSNVKPLTPPSCLGIGWSLSAGGYIARNVKTAQDEKETYTTQAGFFNNHSKLSEIESSSNKSQKLKEYTHLSGNDWYELAADEFSFSCNGYSGTFFMDKDGQWRVVSDDNIKVEFDAQSGFISIDALKSRIQQRYGFVLNNYNSSLNKRLFDKFTLVTPEGTRYEFGGGNATEYSVPYYNQTNGDVMATCWRLSKITTVDQRIVTFEYAADSYMCDIRYAPQKVTYYSDHEVNSAKSQDNIGYSAYTGFLLMPSRLLAIHSDDESVNFEYERDASYGEMFQKSSQCLYWSENSVRYMYNKIEQQLALSRFTLFMGVNASNNAYETRNSIAQKITQDYLSGIKVRKSNSMVMDLYFSFATVQYRKLLSHIKYISEGQLTMVDDCIDEPISPIIKDPIIKSQSRGGAMEQPVSDHSASIINTVKNYEYSFDYYQDGELWPERIPLTYTDTWGYYNRNGANPNNSGEWSFSNQYTPSEFGVRPASLPETKVFVLKSIVYPTGGKTTFEYELNDYSKVFDLRSNTVRNTSGTAGGLRVKSLKYYDVSDALLYSKNYIYKVSLGGLSSGVSKGAPCFYDQIYFESDKSDYMDFYSFADINPYPLNFNTPSVGYSTVFEELRDGNDNLLSRTKFQYTNYDSDINDKSHKDLPADYTANVYDSYASAAFTSMAFERGKLTLREVTDADNHVQERTTMDYVRSAGEPYTVVSQESYVDNYSNLFGFSYMYKAYANRYLVSVSKKQETMDNGVFKSETHYQYNNSGLLSQEKVISNSGESHQKSYIYSNESYPWMDEKNVIVPVEIEEKTAGYANDKWSTTIYTYSPSTMGVPYISLQQTNWGSHGIYPFNVRTDFEVVRADKYGNPIEWKEKGLTTIMLWAYRGQRLIASIQNATYEEVANVLGNSPENYSELNASVPTLDFLRTSLPSALVFTYRYDNRLNLTGKTEPNGMAYTYSYDSLGRLVAEHRHLTGRNELLNTYEYKYSTR